MNIERAIDLLEDIQTGEGTAFEVTPELADAAKFAIKKLEKQQWIPMPEQLPEKGEEVIVTVDGGGRIDAFVSSDVFEAGDWQNWDGVIAWMPLPEPFVPQN